MSVLIKHVKETINPEERLKKKARKAIDVARRIIVEAQAQQLNLQRCAEYQKLLLDNLNNIMSDAVKIGSKPLYIQTANLAEIVGKWYSITQQMMSDQKLMVRFIEMLRNFYLGVMEYRKTVEDFSCTVKEFSALRSFGLSIPREIENSSREAAKAFSDLADSITNLKINYTKLTDSVFLDERDEERLSKRFDEERKRLNSNI